MVETVSCALIGNPVGHSLSPLIHHHFARYANIPLRYEAMSSSVTHFNKCVLDFFKQGGRGLNITSPFKTEAFTLASHHTARALRAKAANTLWYKNDAIYADTTDGVGLIWDIQRLLGHLPQNVFIIGAGGAARGIIDALLGAGVTAIHLYNRTPEKLNALCADFPDLLPSHHCHIPQHIDICIHACSIRNAQDLPPVTFENKDTFAYDLSYDRKNPLPFIQHAQASDLQTSDGLGMLVAQAAESFRIWHDIILPDDLLHQTLRLITTT